MTYRVHIRSSRKGIFSANIQIQEKTGIWLSIAQFEIRNEQLFIQTEPAKFTPFTKYSQNHIFAMRFFIVYNAFLYTMEALKWMEFKLGSDGLFFYFEDENPFNE